MVSRSSSPRRTLSSNAAHSTRSSRDSGNSRPFGSAADGVAGAADALQEAGDRARRAELADQVDVADIDAEFQRRRRHQRLQLAALQPLLGGQPLFLRHAAVMRGDRRLAQAVGQLAGDAFGHAAGVDEHQRGAMRLDQPHQLVVDLLPDLGRHHRFQRRGRALPAPGRAGAGGRYRRSSTSAAGAAVRAGADQADARSPRSGSASPTGRCAAAVSPHSAARRSSDSARCAPRLFGAMAWISSTITVRVVASIARPDAEPSRM